MLRFKLNQIIHNVTQDSCLRDTRKPRAPAPLLDFRFHCGCKKHSLGIGLQSPEEYTGCLEARNQRITLTTVSFACVRTVTRPFVVLDSVFNFF